MGLRFQRNIGVNKILPFKNILTPNRQYFKLKNIISLFIVINTYE